MTDHEISCRDTKEKLDKGEIVLIDCRYQHERDADKIEPSIFMTMDDFPERYKELDPQQPYVIYCAAGVRSLECTFFLKDHGFKDVKNMTGGIEAWHYEVKD